MSLGRDYRKKKKPQETVPPLPEFPKRNTSRRTSSVSRIDVQPRPKRVATRSSSMSTLRTRKTSDSSNYPKRPFDSPSERSSKSTRPFDSPKDRVGPFDFPDKFRQALSSTEKATRPFESLIDYPPTPPISSGSISSYDEDMVHLHH